MRTIRLSSLMIALSFGSVLLIGILFAGGSVWFSHNAMKQQIHQSLQHHGELMQFVLNEKLTTVYMRLNTLSQSRDAQNALTKGYDDKLSKILSLIHDEKEFAIIDRLSMRDIQGVYVGDSQKQGRLEPDQAANLYSNSGLIFENWRLVTPAESAFEKYALVMSLPVSDKPSGRLMGSIQAAIVLDSNAILLSDLRETTGVSELALKIGTDVVASTLPKESFLVSETLTTNRIDQLEGFLSEAVSIEQSPISLKQSYFIPMIKSDQLDVLEDNLMIFGLMALMLAIFVTGLSMYLARNLIYDNALDFVSNIKALANGHLNSDNIAKSRITEFNRVYKLVGHALEGLKKKEQFNLHQLELVSSPLLVWADNGKIIQMNKAARKLFDMEDDPKALVYLSTLIPAMTNAGNHKKCVMHRALDAEFIRDFETQVFNRDTGKSKTFSWAISPIFSEHDSNKIEFCMAQGTDIIRLRKLESAYRSPSFDYKGFIPSIVDLTWKTGTDHTLIKVATPKNVFDRKKFEGFIGKCFWELCEETLYDDQDFDQKICREDFETHLVIQDREVCVKGINGEIIVLKLHAKPIFSKEGKEFKGYAGVAQIITKDFFQRVQLNEAMKRADNANQAKSSFLSSMSHELRTPLNGILGFAQLMLLSKNDNLSERQTEFVKQIVHSGNHLLEMVNGVLDLAKIESHKVDLFLEVIDVPVLMGEVRQILEPISSRSNVKISFGEMPKHNQYLLADYFRMKQILVNLGSNAIKYNKDGGHVIFHCSPSKDEQHLIFRVEDNGIGIAGDMQDYIFQPFTRLDHEHIEGTGIGLAITKELVELMDGVISLESKRDEGSIFSVHMPAFDPTKNQDYLDDNEKPIVLYVEDNMTARLLMEDAVSGFGKVRLKTAPDAEKGLDMIQEIHPDLVLLDINLPGMDGFELLNQIKQDNALSDIPVVAVSAHFHDQNQNLEDDLEFIDYLPKPFKIDELYHTLSQYACSEKVAV